MRAEMPCSIECTDYLLTIVSGRMKEGVQFGSQINFGDEASPIPAGSVLHGRARPY